MRYLIVSLLFFVGASELNQLNAQALKRLADRAKDKLERKAGDKVDKAIDDAVDGNADNKKKADKEKDKGDKEEKTAGSATNSPSAGNTGTTNQTDNNSANDNSAAGNAPTSDGKTAGAVPLQTYSKYDFIPGDKIIAFEDFSDTERGDFPSRWNTNASGEVVTLNNKEGKWFKIDKQGGFHPEFITEIPENFTLEFDLGVNDNWNSYAIAVNIVKLKSGQQFTDYDYNITWQKDPVVQLLFKPAVNSSRTDGASEITAGSSHGESIRNRVTYANWDNQSNKFAHVAIWRQKQRVRVYLNGEKIWDIPRAFSATDSYNAVTLGVRSNYQDGDFFLLGNIRLAAGAPDTRNKLITEGKFVTRGILFDVNSDQIKPESYGALKDIANTLKDNASIRVKVIGHTDSDGDDNSNMELSKRRAAAVKSTLVQEFGLDASRIETDGKGESQPVDTGSSAIAKANNRRVEFVKL